MTNEPLMLPVDEPPKSGAWVDAEDFLANPTAEEVAEGERLGALSPDEDFIETMFGERIPLTEEETPRFQRAISGSELALSEAKKLQISVQKYGVKCTIELMVGRPWTGDDWYSRKYILMNHHTAGSMSGLTPSYALCRRGRTDVPGPLCNGYGCRDLVFRIVCMGLANHPGAGGPLTVDGVTMPKDSARISSFGIEWEHAGLNSTPWPLTMMPFMGRVGAGVLDYVGRKTINSIEHKTWAPTRKIDRNPGFTQSGSTGQALITKYRGGTAVATLDAADKAAIKAIVEAAWAVPVNKFSTGSAVTRSSGAGSGGRYGYEAFVNALGMRKEEAARYIVYMQRLDQLVAGQAALMTALAAATSDPDITPDQIRTIFREEIEGATLTVDVNVNQRALEGADLGDIEDVVEGEVVNQPALGEGVHDNT